MTDLTETIRIRVSKADKDRFETEAERSRLNLSSWARSKLCESIAKSADAAPSILNEASQQATMGERRKQQFTSLADLDHYKSMIEVGNISADGWIVDNFNWTRDSSFVHGTVEFVKVHEIDGKETNR